ncbi:MAG: hemerythrin domain-containing protein [Acidimicrobiales bacterium]
MVPWPTVDILQVLEEDHRAIKEAFHNIVTVPTCRHADAFWALIELLVRHEVAEEAVVYPALRKIPGGPKIADARVAEHSEVLGTVHVLDKLDRTSVEFSAELDFLHQAVLEHAQGEQSEVFPLLLWHDRPQRNRLGERYQAAKRSALRCTSPLDTRSGNLRVGSVAALVEVLRGVANGILTKAWVNVADS